MPPPPAEYSVLADWAHTGRVFIDEEVALFNATLLKTKIDEIFDGVFSGNLTDPTAVPLAGKLWTTKSILVVTAVISAALTGLLLGILVNVAIISGKRKLSGLDALVVNHCCIDMVNCLFVIPVLLITVYVFNGKWPASVVFCHTWFLLRGVLSKASGYNLIVISFHQVIGLISQFLPTCRPAIALRRFREQRAGHLLWLTLLVALVWIVPLASEATFYELEPTISLDRCSIAEISDEILERIIMIEDITTFWLPTSVSAFILIYVAIFSAFFPLRLKSAIADKNSSPHLVFYSPNSDYVDFKDTAVLIDRSQDDELNDPNSRHVQSDIAGPAIQGAHTLVQPDRTSLMDAETPVTEKELSRDTLLVWMVLSLVHFTLIVPAHVILLFLTDSEWAAWTKVALLLCMIKASCADFLAILTVPRYRQRFVALWRRCRA